MYMSMQYVDTLSGDQETINEQDENNMTKLHHAAWHNRCDLVKKLLDRGADVAVRDSQGMTPLHYAAKYKHRSDDEDKRASTSEVIHHLLDGGANINACDLYGHTPLSFAVVRGNGASVEELLACKGIDVNFQDKGKWSALHVAAKYNRIAIAEHLIEAGANLEALTDRMVTSMHVACKEGSVEFIELLIKHFKKQTNKDVNELVNSLTNEGESPLDLAVQNGKFDVTKICLSHGSKVVKKCCRGHSPLHYGASGGNSEICHLLLNQDKDLVHMKSNQQASPLHLAAENDRAEVVKLLVENKSELEIKDINQNTPLLTAVECGSLASVKVLLKNGANVKACNKDEQTVIHIAAKHNRVETLEILLVYLKKQKLIEKFLNADDNIGDGPLHVACEKGYLGIAKLLLKYGSGIKDKNDKEKNPLHIASENGFPELVSLLLETTKDKTLIYDFDELSNSALHLCCAKGHIYIAQILLKAGASLTHSNCSFWTPLMCAVDGGYPELVTLLLEKGAEVDATDSQKNTLLHLASKKGHCGVTKILLQKKARLDLTNDFKINPLETAIKFGQEEVAIVIIESTQWKDALRHMDPSTHDTPLRQLMRKMPDVALRVFERCIEYNRTIDFKDPTLEITFDFDFIDDTYSATYWGNSKYISYYKDIVYDKKGHVSKNAEPYTSNLQELKENHPLNILLDVNRAELLYHPLVLALVRHKWMLAQISYYSFLVFYIIFVSLLTAFMVQSKPPYFYNDTVIASLHMNNCDQAISADFRPDISTINMYFMVIAVPCIWIMCIAGMLIELNQLYLMPNRYVASTTNILDCFTYISAAVVIFPIQECYVRTHWQWQLGCTCMFLAWLNLIMFLRRLPVVGIYIVMVGEVFITFIKFFVFCFSLFIIAFGFTFYSLLQNQESFAIIPHSLSKTLVMMVGELDFGSIFHGGDDFDTQVVYDLLTHVIFILFVFMCTIVIMNLMTGLAVGDVQGIQDQAKVKKLAMQVELALDVEMSISERIRKKLNCTVAHCTMNPNLMASKFRHKFGRYFNGPLSSQMIASVILKDMEKQIEQEIMMLKTTHEGPGNSVMKTQFMMQIHENKQKLEHLTCKVNSMEAKTESIESMLKQLLQKHNIQIERSE